jgi:hypothetical protein
MNTTYKRLLRLFRPGQDIAPEQPGRVEPRLDLMPDLGAAKEAEIDQAVTELNQQVLREIESPERSRAERANERRAQL